jgi:serine-type D-Ala-D-Ala carboxypeptidase (penicillin-binding protein 5/6)
MKRLVTIVAATLVLAAPAHAGAPPVQARAYLVLNSATGEVLASRDAQARVPIASITKLMTVLVTLEHAKLDDVVTVRSQAAAVGESTINLRAGERITVRDLIEGALIQSANDAADALGEYVGHGDASRFVAMMNAKAHALGLDETHFARPDGLDAPEHYSSAHDVTLLARIAMHNPFVKKIVRVRDTTISGNRRLHTWNDLLGSFPGLIGVKTGHTNNAGWCQVAAVRGSGTTIYATILGSPSRSRRNADLAALLRWGLSRYRVARVISTGRPYALVQTGYGRAALPLVAAKAVRRSVRIGRPLVSRVVAAGAVELPVRKGQRLGTVRVYDGRRLLGVRPLVAARAIPRPGLGGRVGFYAHRTVKHLWGLFS